MRILHTMLRTGDLDRSIKFYTEVLGMKLLRRKDYPDGKFTLAFIGYGDESDNTVIELTHNWDTDRYDLGEGFVDLDLRHARVDDQLVDILSVSRLDGQAEPLGLRKQVRVIERRVVGLRVARDSGRLGHHGLIQQSWITGKRGVRS